jgi:hypothetical protein
MSEGLKTTFEIKRSTCDCESVISSFKVNASLITLIQACECKEEGTVLGFLIYKLMSLASCGNKILEENSVVKVT